MQYLGYILSLTGPIFILIAIGSLVVNTGWMRKENVPYLAWFVINIALPAALFKALSSRSFQDILHYDYLLVYGLGSLFTFFALFFFAHFRQKKSLNVHYLV